MVLGPRFLIQAGFIIAVAVVAGIERFGTWTIILLVAGAWLIVAAVELGLWMRNVKARGLTPKGSDPSSSLEPEPTLEPEPVVLQPEPLPTPVPPLTAAPPPPPEPQVEPEPEPEPEPVVTYLPTNDGPREWNLWELERLAREHTSDDVARNEERAYLLMYLREFAGPDGNLPSDFDSLVRDAFGDLLRVGAT